MTGVQTPHSCRSCGATLARGFLARVVACVGLLAWVGPAVLIAAPEVVVRRVPGGGIQPQMSMSSDGTLHLIYMKGDPSHADIFHMQSRDNGGTWSQPVRVNSQPGSAIALGTVRGAHLALGRGGRVHVAWMGSSVATPQAPGAATPMLYTRLADDGKSFEPQRNVIQSSPGLDGGGSVAADSEGNVYVGWHAPAPGKKGEQSRQVWVSRSTDNGATFAPEAAVSDPATGACGCCGMRLFAANGHLLALYRGAAEQIHRGMYLVDCSTDLKQTRTRQIAPMDIGTCVMSTSVLVPAASGASAAWETRGRVFWTQINRNDPFVFQAHEVPSDSKTCKHPAIATDAEGNSLVAWTEETGWNKGGVIAWKLFDSTGAPIRDFAGRKADLPAWDKPDVIFCSNGKLLIVY